ncbi:MAG: DUF2809 domain-containing protein [bacterium]
MTNAVRAYRLRLLASLLVVTPIGFASKLYQGPGAWWLNDYGGGVLYEIFWILLAAWVVPHARSFWLGTSVFLVTSVLEFLQLWHPRFLETLRSTFLGQTLLGTTFVWWDFPHYVLGCALGAWWVHYLGRRWKPGQAHAEVP